MQKLVLAATVGILAACNQPSETKTTNGASATAAPTTSVTADGVVSAADMAAAYAQDETAARTRFHGKQLRISGSVMEVQDADLSGHPYINLHDRMHGVTCYFDKSRLDEVMRVAKGSSLVMEGVVQGFGLGIVTVTGCSIVSVAEAPGTVGETSTKDAGAE